MAPASRPTPPPQRWRLEAVDKGDVVQVISANGNVNPVTSVNVGTQVSGTIIKLHADFNSVVKEGQLLAELDPSLFNAALAQSEANLNSAQAGASPGRDEGGAHPLARGQGLHLAGGARHRGEGARGRPRAGRAREGPGVARQDEPPLHA